MIDLANTNINISQTSNHKLVIDRFENIGYNITECEIPGITLGRVEMATPFGVPIKVLGDSITFDDFTFTFIVDEDFDNYIKIFQWILAAKQSLNLLSPADQITTAEKFFKNNNWYAVCELYILTNKKNLNKKVRFYDCFPTNISQIAFSVRDDAVPVVCSITMSYGWFDFV